MDSNRTKLQPEGFFSRKLKTVINNDADGDFRIFADGDIIDERYQVLHIINQVSGEAVLYKVLDLRNNDEIKVLKMYRRKDAVKPEVLERLSSLKSPFVAGISRTGQVNGLTYIIMPFYSNGSLAAVLEKNIRFTEDEIKTVILPSIIEGLKAIHDSGIIHKDLKPANMMISDDGSRVVLIDFGISSVSGGSTMIITHTGRSPFYSAPETSTGIFWTGSDYYSLGISLYELYTGTTPFQNAGIDDVTRYACSEKIPYPDNFDEDLKDLITGLTYKDISNRNDEGNPDRRWQYREVCAWLSGEKPPVPGSGSGAGTAEAMVPFIFKDQKYYKLRDIAEAMLNSWDKGKKEVFRGFLTKYCELTDRKEALSLCNEAEQEFSKDGALDDFLFFKLMYGIAPEIREFYWKDCHSDNLDNFVADLTDAVRKNRPMAKTAARLFTMRYIDSYISNQPDAEMLIPALHKAWEKTETCIRKFHIKHDYPFITSIFINITFHKQIIVFDRKSFIDIDSFIKYLCFRNNDGNTKITTLTRKQRELLLRLSFSLNDVDLKELKLKTQEYGITLF